jgi:hypothetical protein
MSWNRKSQKAFSRINKIRQEDSKIQETDKNNNLESSDFSIDRPKNDLNIRSINSDNNNKFRIILESESNINVVTSKLSTITLKTSDSGTTIVELNPSMCCEEVHWIFEHTTRTTTRSQSKKPSPYPTECAKPDFRVRNGYPPGKRILYRGYPGTDSIDSVSTAKWASFIIC